MDMDIPMSESNEKLPSLMELYIPPPEGYSELPKWDSSLNYRLKNSELLDAVENPFSIKYNEPSNLDDDSRYSTSERLDDISKYRELLPKFAPPPPHRIEELKNRSRSKLMENQSRKENYDEVSFVVEKMKSESLSGSEDSQDIYLERYPGMKKRKEVILKEIRGDGIKNETDFCVKLDSVLIENEFSSDSKGPPDLNSVTETSFISNLSSKSYFKKDSQSDNVLSQLDFRVKIKENSSSVETDLNNLTKGLREWFI